MLEFESAPSDFASQAGCRRAPVLPSRVPTAWTGRASSASRLRLERCLDVYAVVYV